MLATIGTILFMSDILRLLNKSFIAPIVVRAIADFQI